MTLTSKGRPNLWAMAAIFFLALLLRLVYLRQIAGNPFFDHPIMDPRYHDEWARRIAAGHWTDGQPFFRAPLYAYFLGAIYRLFGHDFLLPRVIQAAIGSATCVLLYLVGRRVWTEAAGLFAGLLGALYVMFIYFDAELLINVLENFLFVALLLLVLVAREAGRRDERRAALWWGLAGLAGGLGAVARPTILAFLPAIGIWMAFSGGGRRVVLRRMLVFGIGLGVAILPVTLHNLIVGGDLVPIASQGGVNFYLGNNPGADGWSATAPEFPRDWWGGYNAAIEQAERARGRSLRASEVSDYWMKRGLDWLRSDPATARALWKRKFLLFWDANELGNNQDFYFFRRFSGLLRGPLPGFGLVAPLGLAGLLLCTRSAAAGLLASYVAIYTLAIVAFFVCDKLRLPVVPALILFAAAFLAWLARALMERRLAAALAAVALAVLAAFPVNRGLAGAQRPTYALSHSAIGAIYLDQGRLVDAEREFRACLAANPAYPRAHLQLGVVLAHLGHLEEAAEHYRAELAQGEETAELHANLGSLLQSQGSYQEAIAHYRRAIELGSPSPELRYNLALSLVHMDQLGEAETWLRQVLSRVPDHVDALNNLGVVMARTGRYDEARSAWLKVLSLRPDFVRARDNLEAMQRERAHGGAGH